MSKHKRLFGRDKYRVSDGISDAEFSCDTHVVVKRVQHDYAKRPTVASHVLRESDGGYSRNARRVDDERNYLSKRRHSLYAVPAFIFVFVAAFVLWAPFLNHSQPLLAQQTTVVTETTQAEVVPLAGSVDETPAANYIDVYKVAASRPRVLTVKALSVRARVLEVGRDGRNQPQLPKNSYDVGWYNASALPEKNGAVVMSGACSGSVGNGVFRRLNELQVGSEISLERGDGGVFAYQVESIETVRADTVNMADVLVPFNRASEGLNLIGCAGSYDSKTNDFANRVIVYAVRI